MVVLDAAVLLEAGWQSMAHEVWVSVIPKDEVSWYIASDYHQRPLNYRLGKFTSKSGSQRATMI